MFALSRRIEQRNRKRTVEIRQITKNCPKAFQQAVEPAACVDKAVAP
jgi:hypothetical protein